MIPPEAQALWTGHSSSWLTSWKAVFPFFKKILIISSICLLFSSLAKMQHRELQNEFCKHCGCATIHRQNLCCLPEPSWSCPYCECNCNPAKWAQHITCSGGYHILQCSWWADRTPLYKTGGQINRGNISPPPGGGGAEHWANPGCVGAGQPSHSLVKTKHTTTLKKLVVSWNWQTSKRKVVDQKAQF
jgi:hypothetical protein